MRAVTTLKQLLFRKKNFFRTRSCLEQLLLSNRCFLIPYAFSDQLLLEDKYFFSIATTLEELLFRISKYSKHVPFQRRHFFRAATIFRRKSFLGAGIS